MRPSSANYFLICAYTICVALEAWTSNAINVVLVDIAGNIRASSDETSWIITIYSAGAAISIVTSHAICRVLGERMYILGCALLFCFSSAGCALSVSLPTLLACRAFQGLAGGAFMSRTLVLLVTHFKAAIRTRPLRYYLLILFVIGRVAAPLCAGFMSDQFSWRSLFWVDVLGSLLAAWFFCIAPRHEKLLPTRTRRHFRFDALGAVLLISGVAGVQVALSRGEVDNWLDSPLIRAGLIVGIAAHVAFALWQIASANRSPLVQLRHLWSNGLFAVVLLGIFLGTLFSAVVYAMPYYLRLVEHHSAFQTGCLMSIIGIPMILFATQAPGFARLVQRIGGRTVLQIGLGMQILSSVLVVLFMTEDTPDSYLIIPLLLSGAFIFFTAVGLALAGFANIATRRISNARTLYFGARQLGNSIGISLGIVLLDRREAFHSQRLLEAFFLRDRSALSGAPDPTTTADVHSFGTSVLTQASVLSYQDFYVVIGAVCILAFFCAWLLPSQATKRAPIDSCEDTSNPAPTGTHRAGIQ